LEKGEREGGFPLKTSPRKKGEREGGLPLKTSPQEKGGKRARRPSKNIPLWKRGKEGDLGFGMFNCSISGCIVADMQRPD